MAKKNVDDSIIKNLKGFCVKGARFESPGNIPTGHFLLDFIIHYGTDPTKVDLSTLENYNPGVSLGLPLGKLVEIFGEEGGGKSSLAYRVIGYAQKLGYPVSWIDTEHSFSENLAKINGCDIDNIYYSNLTNVSQADIMYYAEDVLDAIIELCKSGIKVIVLDSLANLTPKAVGEASADKAHVGLLARMMSINMGKITQNAEKYGTLIIFINQLREKIGLLFGNPETSPGGRAVKHCASVRIQISKKGGKDAEINVFDEDTNQDRLIGKYARVNLKKNRMAKPYFQSIQIPIYYEPYFPDIEDIAFDMGRQIKIISVRKGIFSWNDVKVEGRKVFIDHLKDNNLINDLIKEIKLKSSEENVILPPELMQYEDKDGEKSKKVSVHRGRPARNSSTGKEKSEK